MMRTEDSLARSAQTEGICILLIGGDQAVKGVKVYQQSEFHFCLLINQLIVLLLFFL